MNRLFRISVLLLIVFISFKARSQATLTKGETVSYLDKKIKEVLGYQRLVPYQNSATNYYYYNASVNLDGNKLTLFTERGTTVNKTIGYRAYVPNVGYRYIYPCTYIEQTHTISFNPMQIKSIDLETTSISGQTVGMIKITLKATSAQYNFVATTVNDKFNANAGQFNGQCTSFREVGGERKTTNEVLFTYLKADDTNFNKIKKALLHLQALLNAEDDPFG
ncbi:hypothetical protein [Sediminibacterium sp.]|uniref:hypothetical protein n=1 Tax=Sediminibacterium sp. TaxID=1917865 RepID=UPI0025FE0249|nr:hypothetical protein [Sediminibacterium sp.]MBW0176664.1 hypothetical protein [Sediminibacterium sp.]